MLLIDNFIVLKQSSFQRLITIGALAGPGVKFVEDNGKDG